MRLSDNEKRDAIKLLQEGKPLPDKYRFLLFEADREVELVWNGKTQEVCNLVLPFQTIEHIDEPRSQRIEKGKDQLMLFDTSGRQIRGWTNKLIWGDNKLILSSLKNGPMRQEIEKQGGLKLVYIDPPFSAGLDYGIDVQIGDEPDNKLTKAPSVLEEFAYRNTWGSGGNTFLSMLYERISLIRGLLSSDGIFFIRIDHHWGHYVKAMVDEIFVKDLFQSEVIVNRIKKNVTNQGKLSLPTSTDTFFIYFKTNEAVFKHISAELDEERAGYWRRTDDSSGERHPRERHLFGKVFEPPPGKHFKFSQKRMDLMIKENKLRYNERIGRLEYWVEPSGTKILDTNWTDIPGYSFSTGYPTENAEILLERVIDISTNKGDLVADFFCGSGTTLAAAEKLGRKWIGSDIGRFAIHTSRKRLIQVQREMKKESKDFRAFEILNLGKYEREHYVSVEGDFREQERQQILENKEKQFIELILAAYSAQAVDSYNSFVGKKRDRLVAVGPINTPVSSLFVNEAIKEAQKKGITKFDVLGFDYEMGLDFAELSRQGVDVQFKVIPREVFDRRAVEKGHVKFYDVAYIEVKPTVRGRGNNKTIAVELSDFSVFYNQDSVEGVEGGLKEGASKIVIENGQVIKVSKDKKTGLVSKEVLTKKWTDWVDYWAIDFDFTSRKEVVRLVDPVTNEEKEEWTGTYIFENEWQSFRTKKDRKLELVSAEKEVSKGRRKIAVKVVDIFGNDTTRVIEVNIP